MGFTFFRYLASFCLTKYFRGTLVVASKLVFLNYVIQNSTKRVIWEFQSFFIKWANEDANVIIALIKQWSTFLIPPFSSIKKMSRKKSISIIETVLHNNQAFLSRLINEEWRTQKDNYKFYNCRFTYHYWIKMWLRYVKIPKFWGKHCTMVCILASRPSCPVFDSQHSPNLSRGKIT